MASPFIAWYPGHIPPNQLVGASTHIIDVLPTIMDLAGESSSATTPRQIEGRSLLPLLAGEHSAEEARPLYFEHMGNCGLIEGDWKLVRHRNQPWELYRLSVDRSETVNLASSDPARLSGMILRYETWAKKNGVLPWETVEADIPYAF